MAKTNFGYVGAGGLQAFQNSLQQIIADRVANQELAKKEALAREALWQQNLEGQRDFNLRQEQLGISKGTLRVAQDREAREAAEAARPAAPKPRVISGLTIAGTPGKFTMIVDDNNPSGPPLSKFQEYVAPDRVSTTPVKGLDIGGQPHTVFYDESGNRVGDPVREYDPPKGAGAPKPPTGQQQKWMGFYQQMSAANKIIEETETKLNKKDLFLLNTAGLEGAAASGSYYLLSDAGKQYAQAMTEFLEAGLRDASGAQFNKTEFPVRGAIYMGHLADSPAARANRRNSRRNAVQNAGRKAGPAFEQEYGRPYDSSEDAITSERPAAPPKRLTQDASGNVTEGRAAAPTVALTPAPKKKTKLTVGPNGQLIEVEVQ